MNSWWVQKFFVSGGLEYLVSIVAEFKIRNQGWKYIGVVHATEINQIEKVANCNETNVNKWTSKPRDEKTRTEVKT